MEIKVVFYNLLKEDPTIPESICIMKRNETIYKYDVELTVKQFIYDVFNKFSYKCNINEVCTEMVRIYIKEFDEIFNLSNNQLNEKFYKVFEKNIKDNNEIILQDIPDYMGAGCWGESQGLRYIINSNEQKHEFTPHVHVQRISKGFTDRIRIIECDIMDTSNNNKPLSNKLRKEAIRFIRKNQIEFLEYWNENTNCIKKVDIDVFRKTKEAILV